MQEGRVLESGDHATLMQRDGLYAEMWTRQADLSRLAPSVDPGSPPSDPSQAASALNGADELHHPHNF